MRTPEGKQKRREQARRRYRDLPPEEKRKQLDANRDYRKRTAAKIKAREAARRIARPLEARKEYRFRKTSGRLKRLGCVVSVETLACTYTAQGGLCAGCGNHTTGIFRAWLCPPCNLTLGCVADDPDTLRALALYLEAHS